MATKIATCSYCGTRAALVFDEGLHELTCRACGAPLHDMKFMPQTHEKEEKTYSKTRHTKTRSRRSVSKGRERDEWRDWPARKKRKKKHKPMARRVFEELWDVVEDIFD